MPIQNHGHTNISQYRCLAENVLLVPYFKKVQLYMHTSGKLKHWSLQLCLLPHFRLLVIETIITIIFNRMKVTKLNAHNGSHVCSCHGLHKIWSTVHRYVLIVIRVAKVFSNLPQINLNYGNHTCISQNVYSHLTSVLSQQLQHETSCQSQPAYSQLVKIIFFVLCCKC